MNNTRHTIGDAIRTKGAQYIEIYDKLCIDPVPGTDAAMLAKHDLTIAIFINEEALKLLLCHIAKCENE